MSRPTAHAPDAATKANLAALADLLGRAANDARDARSCPEKNERNTAIGTIVDLDQLLADAALHGAAMALHRRSRR